MLKASLGAEIANRTYGSGPHTYVNLEANIVADFEMLTDLDGGKVQCISPRGTTKDARDWLLDFSSWPHLDYDLGWVPNGFDDAADYILPDIYRGIDPKIPVWIPAHSLGGAIGLHLAAKLADRGVPIYGVYTYGCPRAGSRKLKHKLADKHILQFRRGNDPVAEVPWLLGFYRHQRPLISVGHWRIDPFDCHHCAGYVEDVAEWEKAGSPLTYSVPSDPALLAVHAALAEKGA